MSSKCHVMRQDDEHNCNEESIISAFSFSPQLVQYSIRYKTSIRINASFIHQHYSGIHVVNTDSSHSYLMGPVGLVPANTPFCTWAFMCTRSIRCEIISSSNNLRLNLFSKTQRYCVYSSLHGQHTHRGAVKTRSRASLARPPDNVPRPPPAVSPAQRAAPREHPTRTECQGEQCREVQPLPLRHAQDAPTLRRPHRGSRPRRRGRADALAGRSRCHAEPSAR